MRFPHSCSPPVPSSKLSRSYLSSSQLPRYYPRPSMSTRPPARPYRPSPPPSAALPCCRATLLLVSRNRPATALSTQMPLTSLSPATPCRSWPPPTMPTTTTSRRWTLCSRHLASEASGFETRALRSCPVCDYPPRTDEARVSRSRILSLTGVDGPDLRIRIPPRVLSMCRPLYGLVSRAPGLAVEGLQL